MSGTPVVIAANGYGTPVRPVDSGAPVLTVAENGFGMPIVISDLGAPFVVEGLFNPAMLFSSGAQGAYYDPNDRTTLFQDAAGTTPANLPGDPVGLALDKSKGLVLGPELVGLEGWTASNGTLSLVDGVLTLTAIGTGTVYATKNITTVAGSFYKLSAQQTGGTINAYTSAVFTGFQASLPAVPQIAVLNDPSAPTPVTWFFTASTVGQAISMSSASIRELPGYHATQSVAASRPTLARHPKGGRRNLLDKTEDLLSAPWGGSGGTIAAAPEVVAPDGTRTAFKVSDFSTSTGTHQHAQYIADVPAGAVHTFSAYVKAAERSAVNMHLGLTGSHRAYIVVDLATGAVLALADSSSVYDAVAEGSGVTSVGGGWYRIAICMRNIGTEPAGMSAVITPNEAFSYGGAVGQGVYVWHPQCERATGTTAYQRVTSLYDVTEAGVPDCWYLAFDGVDDFLVTPAIDLTGTDKIAVFAGVRKLSDAGTSSLVEFSATPFATNGSFSVLAPLSAQPRYNVESRGTTNVGVSSTLTFAAPITNVIALLANIALPEIALRVNGAPNALTTASQGTGNYGNHPLYIGRRGGTSNPFNGILYGLAVVGKLPNAAEITSTEKFLNDKMGAY